MSSSNQEQHKSTFGFGKFRTRSYHIFMRTKEKTIKEEWEQMTEEEKKPYNEQAEKKEERIKAEKEEKEKKKSQEDSSKFKFIFNIDPFRKTSFDFYRESRREILTTEWDKMTEEEKKPYIEMEKEELKEEIC